MSKKLTKDMAFIVLAVLLLLSFIFIVYYRQNQRSCLENILRTTANQIEEVYMAGGDAALAAKAQENVLRQAGINALRISLLDANGELLYDTVKEATSQRVRSKEEVKRTLQGEDWVYAERYEEGHNRFLYLSHISADRSLIIRTATGLRLDFPTTFLLMIILLGALVLLSIYLVVRRNSQRYALCLERIEKGLKDFTEEKYDVLLPEIDSAPFQEVHTLTGQFNQTALSLKAKDEYMYRRMARLGTILNTMVDPLLLVNKEKNLLYVNRVANEVFERDINPEETPYPQLLLTHSEELDDILDESILSEKDIETIIELSTASGAVRYKTLVSPILVDEEVHGLVIALHDLSVEEEASAFRRDFIANVTHELKTPLTSLRGFIDTLQNREHVTPGQTNRFLEIMDVEAQRLEVLINDILSLSEIESGRIRHTISFDLSELIDEVIVLLDEQASEKKIALYTSEEMPERLMVRAERDRIKQILINLTENAIKYGKKGGTVELGAKWLYDGRVQISVKDNGPGIPKEAQKRIFERFYRVDSSRSRDLGGTGLGLSIVKHIAQLYHGEATVESTPGQGSTFFVRLKI